MPQSDIVERRSASLSVSAVSDSFYIEFHWLDDVEERLVAPATTQGSIHKQTPAWELSKEEFDEVIAAAIAVGWYVP